MAVSSIHYREDSVLSAFLVASQMQIRKKNPRFERSSSPQNCPYVNRTTLIAVSMTADNRTRVLKKIDGSFEG